MTTDFHFTCMVTDISRFDIYNYVLNYSQDVQRQKNHYNSFNAMHLLTKSNL